MSLRLLALGTLLAALPVAIEVPAGSDSTATAPDAPRGETRIELLGGTGRYVTLVHGCDNSVIREIHNQVNSGSLSVEHRSPHDWVVGLRTGSSNTVNLQTKDFSPGEPVASIGTNSWVNPYAGWEGAHFGAGLGYVHLSRPIVIGEDVSVNPEVSGHIRLQRGDTYFAMRWMEATPMQLGNLLTCEAGMQPTAKMELAATASMLGPYDGTLLGLNGRFWLTRDAALRLSVACGNYGQYHIATGATLKFADPR